MPGSQRALLAGCIALGLTSIGWAQAGGQAIVQDPKGAFASTMPRAALAETPGARVLSLEDIVIFLQGVGKR